MNMRKAAVWLLVGLAAPGGAVNGGPAVRFSTPPTATRDAAGVKVRFAVSSPTDVEVAVLDNEGKVVRHLAAGVIGGPGTPPAPLKPGLAQELTWDGKDDLGVVRLADQAKAGPFKVRVRAGTTAKRGLLISQDPYIFGGINSICTDETGRLYCMGYDGGLNQNFDTLRVFAPDGQYLRTVIPFPANLSPAAAAGFAAWDETAKVFHPKNRLQVNPAIVPWVAGARVASVSGKGAIVLTHGTDVYRLDPDGGNLRGPLPMWSKQAKLENPSWNVPRLAVSPDGRYIYYSNVAGTKYDTKTPQEINPNWPNGRVYRQDTSRPGSDPERFFDLTLPDFAQTKYWMPNAWNKRTAAGGIDTDDKGNLYVCDLVNQEVVQVSPQGKRLASVKVPWPDRVHVNRADSTLYVISSQPKDGSRPEKLLKLSGCTADSTGMAELPLMGRLGDASALGLIEGRPVLWLAGGGKLVCLRDAGGKFEEVETKFRPGAESQHTFSRMAVDATRNEIYTSDGASRLWRYDGKTGRGELLKKGGKPFDAVDLAVGYDGLLYIRTGAGFSGPLERFTRELEPAPYPATGTHVLSKHIYSRYGVGNCEKGLGVGPSGEVYISFMYGWNDYLIVGFGGDGRPIQGRYLKGQYKPDPKLGVPADLDSAVIGPVPAESGGIRVDVKGDIYVGARVKPKEFQPPAGFEKDPAHPAFTGSVIRFTPRGGTFLGLKDAESADPALPRLELAGKLTAEGATAVYPGVAPFSGGGYGANSSVCVCRVPRFDVDRYGRLALPNCVTNSVIICDNAGNRIVEFGAYGSFDSQFVPAGSAENKPLVAAPEIPLGWPTGAGVCEDFVYVNDTLNRRVVRVDLAYAAEEVCDFGGQRSGASGQ